jgi:hypothetical protein
LQERGPGGEVYVLGEDEFSIPAFGDAKLEDRFKKILPRVDERRNA